MKNSKDSRQTVLVVDDMPDNITLLSSILSDTYKVKAANNGQRALKIAISDTPDLILLDIMMPGTDGYDVCRQLKADPRSRNIPVIFITALGEVDDETLGFELGAADYITKPVSPPIVLSRVKTHLDLFDQKRLLEKQVLERTRELNSSRLEIIRRLGRAAEFRDNETGMHVIRMSQYCRILAEGIGMDQVEAEMILNATPMHDIGKIGIQDRILLKPGRLTVEEAEIMQQHAEFGARIIGDHENTLLQAAKTAALTHHERWDGTGYPGKLKGEEIPIIGRITALADVFDALTSERPYKRAWPIEEAVEYIKEERGLHFDPVLTDIFLENLDKIREIYLQHPDQTEK